MSTHLSQTPATGPGSAQAAESETSIAWPILVIGRNDRFVHVLSERDLDAHHDGPHGPGPVLAQRTTGPETGGDEGEPGPAVPVDFFDRDGRRLRPIVATDFTFLGVEATAALVPTGVLMQRLDRAVGWALTEMTDRAVDVVTTPELPNGDYGDYLDDLAKVFGAVPTDGSAWHNFVHTIT